MAIVTTDKLDYAPGSIVHISARYCIDGANTRLQMLNRGGGAGAAAAVA